MKTIKNLHPRTGVLHLEHRIGIFGPPQNSDSGKSPSRTDAAKAFGRRQLIRVSCELQAGHLQFLTLNAMASI
jgi:hypothetical protein